MANPVFTPVTPADATFSVAGAAAWAAGMTGPVTDANLTVSDVTTNNVSTLAHGFAPKITNTANFLKGDGTWASPGTNSGPTFPGGIPMTGIKFPSGNNVSVSTGDTDLYTVPANKRAFIRIMGLMNNSGVGNIGWFPEIKISGSYFRLGLSQTTSNGAFATIVPNYIAEAGEIFAVNTITNNGACVTMEIVEFDNTIALKTAKLTTLSAGDNPIYTVPAATTSYVVTTGILFGSSGGLLNYVNSSGLGRTIAWKYTPNGGSATQINAGASPANNAKSNIVSTLTMGAGDALVINTDANTATQFAWVNVMETS